MTIKPARKRKRRTILVASMVERFPVRDTITDHFDAHTRGLALRVYPSGRKAWMLFHRDAGGRLRRATLGTWPDLGLADARVKAGEQRPTLAAGTDGRTAKRAARAAEKAAAEAATANTVRVWWERYAELEGRKLRSWPDRQAQFDHDIADTFGDTPITALSRAEVRTWLEFKAQTAPIRANALYRTLRRFCQWLVEREALDVNPVAAVKKPTKEAPRDRVLTAKELGALWRVLTAGPLDDVPMIDWLPQTRDAVLVLLLTGARLGEVARMSWADLTLDDADTASWRIPAEDAKNGESRTLALSKPTHAVLARLAVKPADPRYVFAVPHRHAAPAGSQRRRTSDPYGRVSAAARPLREALGFDFTLHDLRRSTATHLVEHGTRPDVVAAVLGHASVLKGTVTGRHYLHADYGPQIRTALVLWARVLAQYASDAKTAGNVLAFGGAR